MGKHSFWLLVSLVFSILLNSRSDSFAKIKKDAVTRWARAFSKKLVDQSADLSCLDEIERGFKSGTSEIRQEDPAKMLDEFRKNIQQLFEWKKQHVEKIALKAEEASVQHVENETPYYDYYNMNKLYDSTKNETKEGVIPKSVSYYEDLTVEEKVREQNKWHDLQLYPHPKFKSVPVNFAHTGVHVPVNVFNEKPSLMQGIEWSTHLKETFRNNYRFDPEVSWQFFCSSDGFMRLYPASKWRVPEYLSSGEKLDLYDCRLKNWYIKAAASPRDIIILLDRSGSMTGQRSAISQNVVVNILDSLTDDDFVSLFVFRDNVTEVVECFGRRLVQANKQNVATFKKFLRDEKTENIANFTAAFTDAFELLEETKRNNSGAQCNQAIMLVTDGAPDSYTELFDGLNSDFDEYERPRVPVRVFTYLVGKEVTDTQEVYNMACKNRGYYTHVANMAEVREQVQLYVPVMSRPLVIKKERVFIYTSVYTDITDVPLLGWVWDGRERERIRENIQKKLRENQENPDSIAKDNEDGDDPARESLPREEKDYEDLLDKRKDNESISVVIPQRQTGEDNSLEGDPTGEVVDNTTPSFNNEESDILETVVKKSKKKTVTGFAYPMVESRGSPGEGIHDLMLTVATPVFDQKDYTNITVRYLYKNLKMEKTVTVRSANLLGVAGVDVPIRQIVRYTPAYRLGVNGYSFAINNNGYLLYHPDLRPLFQDLIKPFYNSVDLNEVELSKNYNEARKPEESVQTLRRRMLERETNSTKIEVKMHLDSMKRVVVRTNSYYFGPIADSPFILGIALPKSYGQYRFDAQVDVRSTKTNHSQYFSGNNWRIHPEWFYCNERKEAIGDEIENVVEVKTPEEELLNALSVLANPNPEEESVKWFGPSVHPLVYKGIMCDKDLLQSLVYDGRATDLDLKTCGRPGNDRRIKTLGVALNFVATRSGLTRFYDHRDEREKFNLTTDKIFAEIHKRATDELFYQRAVDYNRYNASAFIFSVPFESAAPEEIYVLGARALFFGTGVKKAPAATVGLFFKQKNFAELFFNLSTNVVACEEATIGCFVIDNNGFVVVSDQFNDTGKLLSEVDLNLFKHLVHGNRLFREVQMFDFQAICIQRLTEPNFSNILQNPFRTLANLFLWFWAKVVMLSVDVFLFLVDTSKVSGQYFSDYEGEYGPSEEGYAEDGKGKRLAPNRTQPYPCDKKFYLYETYRNISTETPYVGNYELCNECQAEYIAHVIPNTNLLLVISHSTCSCKAVFEKINPTEIIYEGPCAAELLHVDRFRTPPNITCINYEKGEKDIEMCGKGWTLLPPHLLLLLLVAFIQQNIWNRHLVN